jgi:lysophospholipase L1-like esterase
VRDDALNSGLCAVASESKVSYKDLLEPMGDPAGRLRPDLSHDDLHHVAPAYDIWREAIRPYVKA